MPSSKNLEILQGREPTEPAGGQTRRSTVSPPSQTDEVSGRSGTTRAMECWKCHGLTYVEFDPDAYHLYTCCHCNAVNQF